MQVKRVVPYETLFLDCHDLVGILQPDDYVSHIAMVSCRSFVVSDEVVAVDHIGPPMEINSNESPREAKSTLQIDVCGYAAYLTIKQRRRMKRWLRAVKLQTPKPSSRFDVKHYVVNPPTDWVFDERSRKPVFRRFNCASFVAKCYEEGAVVKLVDCDSTAWPDVSFDEIRKIYGKTSLLFTRFGDAIGVPDRKEPWPILLPGYVLNAIKVEPASLPYLATSSREAVAQIDD